MQPATNNRNHHGDTMGGADMAICDHGLISTECPFCLRAEPAKQATAGDDGHVEPLEALRLTVHPDVRRLARQCARAALRGMCRSMPTVQGVIEAAGPAVPGLLVQLAAAKIERILVTELGLPAPPAPACSACYDEGEPINGCDACGKIAEAERRPLEGIGGDHG